MKSILWGIFEKSQILARDVFKTSPRRHGTDIFFQICSRCLEDVIQKTSFLRFFLDVLKASQKSHLIWDVSKRSLRCLPQWRSDWDLSETCHASWAVTFLQCIMVTSKIKHALFQDNIKINICIWIFITLD